METQELTREEAFVRLTEMKSEMYAFADKHDLSLICAVGIAESDEDGNTTSFRHQGAVANMGVQTLAAALFKALPDSQAKEIIPRLCSNLLQIVIEE